MGSAVSAEVVNDCNEVNQNSLSDSIIKRDRKIRQVVIEDQWTYITKSKKNRRNKKNGRK